MSVFVAPHSDNGNLITVTVNSNENRRSRARQARIAAEDYFGPTSQLSIVSTSYSETYGFLSQTERVYRNSPTHSYR